MEERKKDQPRITVCNPDQLALRGLVQCPKCTRLLTGSESKGKTKYIHYYHCRSSCGVRYRAEDVSNAVIDYLTTLIPRHPEKVITEIVQAYKTNAQVVKSERKVVLSKINDCNHRVEKAQELLLGNDLEPFEYRQIKE